MASSGWYLSLLGQLNFFNPLDVSLRWEHTHYSSIQSLCNSPRRLLERCQSPVGSTVHHRVQGVMGKSSHLQIGGQVPQFAISKGHRALGHERKQAICSIPQPNTKKEVHEFLGVARCCPVQVPAFSEIAKPLFKAEAGSGKNS